MTTDARQASGERLHRSVGLTGVVMLGAGTAIGVSIFSVLQPASQLAGAGLLVAMLIAAIPMILFAISYAYLASAMPVSGASYEWPRYFLHPAAGFAIAWLRILGNTGAIVVLAKVMVSYLGMAFPLPEKLVIGAAITLVFAVNYLGVGVAAWLQTALMAVLLTVLATIVATGLPLADFAKMGPVTLHGWSGIIACVPLMISLFIGIESAVEIGEEVREPRRIIPAGIALATLLTILVYGAVATVSLALIGPLLLSNSEAPLVDAARVALGPWAMPLVIGAATVSILKTMNATAMVFARSIYSMARAGALPSALAAVHPRFGTPHMALLACYICAMAGLLLPSDLVFLLLAVNIPTMLKYGACSLSAIVAASSHPDIHARAIGFKRSTMIGVGWAAVVAAAAMAIAGLEADWRPYLLVGVWLVIGLAGYGAANILSRRRKVRTGA